jgi:hypothetical protein
MTTTIMPEIIDNDIPNQLALMLSKKMKLTSSPKQEKVVSFNLNQSNKSELEKLNYLYPSISKEVKFIFFKHLNRIYQKFFLNQNLT